MPLLKKKAKDAEEKPSAKVLALQKEWLKKDDELSEDDGKRSGVLSNRLDAIEAELLKLGWEIGDYGPSGGKLYKAKERATDDFQPVGDAVNFPTTSTQKPCVCPVCGARTRLLIGAAKSMYDYHNKPNGGKCPLSGKKEASAKDDIQPVGVKSAKDAKGLIRHDLELASAKYKLEKAEKERDAEGIKRYKGMIKRIEKEMAHDDLQPVGDPERAIALKKAKDAVDPRDYDIAWGNRIQKNINRLAGPSKQIAQELFDAGKFEEAEERIERQLGSKRGGSQSKRSMATRDDLQPVGEEDPERAIALKKHEEGVTKSQDRRSKDMKNEIMPVGDNRYAGLSAATRENIRRGLEDRLKNGTERSKEEAKKLLQELDKGEAKDADAVKCWECGERFPSDTATYPMHQTAGGKKCKMSGKKVKGYEAEDELPTAIKPVGLMPMPSGERNEASYAPRKAKDGDPRKPLYVQGEWRVMPTHDPDKLQVLKGTQLLNEVDDLAAAKRFIAAKSAAKDGKLSEEEKVGRRQYGLATSEARRKAAAEKKAAEKAKATDSVIDPQSHLDNAVKYEIGQDRARALDAYRAAASGFRAKGDEANEAKARDGVAACQTLFSGQYDHPGRGRVKVCDSVDVAKRTALERTRAGEVVSVAGKTVRPGRVGDADKTPKELAAIRQANMDSYEKLVWSIYKRGNTPADIGKQLGMPTSKAKAMLGYLKGTEESY